MVAGFEEKDRKGEVPLSSHHTDGACCQHDVDLDPVAEVALVRFLHCKGGLTLFSLFHVAHFGSKSPCTAHTSGGES